MTEAVQTTQPRSPSPRRRWAHLLVWGCLIAFLTLVGLALLRTQAGQLVDAPAPDIRLQQFDGGQFVLSEQRGSVVMIDFWASWCVPCRAEASQLELLWQEYQNRGVVFVGVSYADTEAEARAFLDEFAITYPNGPDLGTRASQAYRIRGVPEKFFVDRCGRIRDVVVGPVSVAQLRQNLESLLAESALC